MCFHGIDPELGVVNASPAHAARAAELRVLRVVGRDLKTEAEFIVAGAKRKRFGARLSASGCSSTKIDPMLFSPIIFTELSLRIFAGPQMPAVEHHAHELAVILHGRVEAAIAAERGRRRRRDGRPRLFLQAPFMRLYLRRPRATVWRAGTA